MIDLFADILGFSTQVIFCLSMKTILLLPFNLHAFYFISPPSKTSSALLNGGGGTGYFCLISIGESIGLSPFSVILAVGFSLMLLIKLSKFSSISPLLKIFIRNECWILSSAFSSGIEMPICAFYLYSGLHLLT